MCVSRLSVLIARKLCIFVFFCALCFSVFLYFFIHVMFATFCVYFVYDFYTTNNNAGSPVIAVQGYLNVDTGSSNFPVER